VYDSRRLPMNDKYINLNWGDRFVDWGLLRDSYVKYDDSHNPTAPNFVTINDDLELGIVSSQVPEIARAISSVLSRSLEDAKNVNEGYLPDAAVERVQREIISPYGIANLWGTTGHRFVLSQRHGSSMREIIASILIGQSKDTIFFLTGKYNNIRQSTIKEQVDLNLPDDSGNGHKWFDRFAFPDLDVFKPQSYHQMANFVVNKEQRDRGYARLFLGSIVKYYSRDHLDSYDEPIIHSQHLLCGKGLWQIGDPPWLPKMQALGFYRRAGAESFFIDQPWAPLTPVYWLSESNVVSNLQYNEHFGLPRLYDEPFTPSNKTDQHLLDRIPEVIRLSKDPRAKLQYFQAMYNFT
jgi:hypothetical protein